MVHNIMFISAISPLHNGAGEGLGLIDRPIMRERTTNFPIIQSTSLKGVMRDEYEATISKVESSKEKGKEKTEWLFGPLKEGSKHAGCISFSDAAILAFPVRSLQGNFVWAISPLVLYRFQRSLEFASLSQKFPNLQALINKRVLHSEMTEVLLNPDAQSVLLINRQGNTGKGKLILEEFPKDVGTAEELRAFAAELGRYIFGSETSFKEEFERKLVVLPDDMFNYFVTYATEVVPNIRIDDKTGTTAIGSLRYSEYLPAETVLYTVASFGKSFAKQEEFDTDIKVRNFFMKNKPQKSAIQIGGDETKGKGFVQISFVEEGENG